MSKSNTRERLWVRVGAIVAVAGLAGCPDLRPRIDPDLTPPFLRGVQPSGNAVSIDATFEIELSEPVLPETLFWFDEDLLEELPDSVVLTKAANEEYLSTAMKSPPLSATQRAKAIPASVELSADGATITLTPDQPLEGLTDYVIILSEEITDLKNNKLVDDLETKVEGNQIVRFTTTPAADRTKPTATLVTPPAGATGVAIDLQTVEIQFSEPMKATSVIPARVGLIERASQLLVTPSSVVLDGDVAKLTLPKKADNTTLVLNGVYDLFVSVDVTDQAGNGVDQPSLLTQTFTAARCTDTAAPRIATASVLAGSIGDQNASISWATDEPSDSLVEYIEGNSATDLAAACDSQLPTCLVADGPAATCPASVDICALPSDQAAFACTHRVTLSGLAPSKQYTYRVVSADSGNRQTVGPVQQFATRTELPRVRLNELFVSPNTPPSTAGEFIELFNAGGADVDLTGWKVATCLTKNCEEGTNTPVTLSAATTGGSMVLGAGKYAVIGSSTFATSGVPVGDGAVRLKSTLGLTDSFLNGYALLDAQGSLVSSYGGHLGSGSASGKKGHSFERKVADDADTAGNWAVSTAALAGLAGNFATPGAKNSVSP